MFRLFATKDLRKCRWTLSFSGAEREMDTSAPLLGVGVSFLEL